MLPIGNVKNIACQDYFICILMKILLKFDVFITVASAGLFPILPKSLINRCMDIDFLKMHGAGNDFVVLDSRTQPLGLTPETLQRIADRRVGIGCDQILVLENGQDVFMRIYNADGSEAEACGNGTRCVAWWLSKQLGHEQLTVQTVAGDLSCSITGTNQVQVDMGKAELIAENKDPIEVKLGNPHKVFFVADCETVDWQDLCKQAGNDANVSAAQIINSDSINLRVWERGAGLTQACGSGACATVVAAHSRKLVSSKCQVLQPGGSLEIAVDDSDTIQMTGPVALSYKGTFNLNTLMYEK